MQSATPVPVFATETATPPLFSPSLSSWTLQVIFVTVSVFCLLLSFYALYFFTRLCRKRWHIMYYIPVWLTFIVSFIPVPTIIVDVDCSAFPESPMPRLIVYWYVVFWSTQVLCWLWLPLAQSYDEDGHFRPVSRLLAAIKLNVILYILMGTVMAALMVFVAFQKGVVTPAAFISLCTAAANSFGLLLVATFVGYALVEFPRSIGWRSSVRRELLRAQFEAAAVWEQLEALQVQWCDESATALDLASHLPEKNHKNVHSPAGGASSPISVDGSPEENEVADAIRSVISFVHANEESASVKAAACAPRVRHVHPTVESLVELHQTLRNTVRLLEQADFRWKWLCSTAFLLEDVIAAKGSTSWKEMRIPSTTRPPKGSFVAALEWLWWLKIRWVALKGAAVVAGLLSLLIFASELVVAFVPRWSPIALLVRGSFNAFGTATPVMTIVLGYTSLLGAWGIFRLPMASAYLPVPSYTPPASLCFIGTLFCRLLIPLCNNFLLIATHPIDGLRRTSFRELLGDLSTTGFLGPWFSRFFLPLLLSIVVILNAAHIPSRVAASLGMQRFVLMTEPSGDASSCEASPEFRRVAEGRRVLQHARIAAQRALSAEDPSGLRAATRHRNLASAASSDRLALASGRPTSSDDVLQL